MPLLVEWIKEFSAPLNVTVKTIEYGGQSVLSQAVHSQEADILVALHGADLTNLVFQRAGAMVIELNPIFFFESGYYEMARALGLRYGAWTCTAPSCAFRGQLDVWGRFLPANKISYNATTGAVVIPSVGSNVSLKWPFKGYAGGCRPCKQILDSDVVRPHFYSALRDSVILVKDHKHELADVFNDAFSQLGWQ